MNQRTIFASALLGIAMLANECAFAQAKVNWYSTFQKSVSPTDNYADFSNDLNALDVINGNWYRAGNVFGKADMDPSTNKLILDASSDPINATDEDDAEEMGTPIVSSYVMASGKLSWAKKYTLVKNQTKFVKQSAIASSSAGSGMYVGGTFAGNFKFGTTSLTSKFATFESPDFYIIKLSASGSVLGAIQLKAKSPNISVPTLLDLKVDKYGSVVALLNFGVDGTAYDVDPSSITNYVTGNTYDLVMVKYDANLKYQWSSVISTNGAGNYLENNSMNTDEQGNIILSGRYWQEPIVAKIDFDPSTSKAILPGVSASIGQGFGYIAKYTKYGQLTFVKGLGQFTQSASILNGTDVNGNIYLSTHIINNTLDMDLNAGVTNKSGRGAVLAKYTSAGAYVWSLVDSSFYARPKNFAVDAKGNTYLSNVTTNSNGTTQELSIVKYSTTAVAKWGNTIKKSIGYTNVSYIENPSLLVNNQHVYLAADFYGKLNLLGAGGVITNTTNDLMLSGFMCRFELFGSSLLVANDNLTTEPVIGARLTNNELNVNEDDSNGAVIYPNPASEVLNVKANGLTSVEILNISGQVIKQQNFLNVSSEQINISDLENGVYFIKVIANGKLETKRFIKSN